MNTKTLRTRMRTRAAIAVALLACAPMAGASVLSAQSSRAAQPSVPRDYLPPANMCRVWIDGVPAAQQPAPTDCPTAIQKKPANARVIYGEEKGKGVEKLPAKGLTKPLPEKRPPLIPPDIQPTDPQYAKAERERKRITDDQLYGEQQPTSGSASSYQGATSSQQGSMGSYSGYVAPGGVVVGGGALQDPRYFNGNPNVRPPGYGSSACLDRDGDGWCDDSRFGPPVCLDKDQDGRCDDLPGFASQAYPQVLPPMRAALDVIQGRPSAEVMTWLGTNEFIVRVPDQGRGGVPWRALFLDTNNELLQVWTDTNRDGRADRVEIFRNGQRVKLIQR